MVKTKLYLQLFAEGGGSGAGSEAGSTGGAEGTAETGNAGATFASGKKGNTNPLADVVYGVADPGAGEAATETTGNTTDATEDTHQTFDEMIKKGGKYHDEFQKKSQAIINERFKQTKELQESLDKQSPILNMLYDKYGVKAGDMDALQKALNDDESFYEQAAFEQGLSVEQYKHQRELERQVEGLKQAEEQRQRQANNERIYAQWQQEGEAFAQKYGIKDYNFDVEIQNPKFQHMLGAGIDLETAYKAVHFDQMLTGAMATTADNVRTQLANSIATRQSRPSENGVTPQNSKIFKSDVSKLTAEDRAEIARRVKAGANIRFQ